MVCLHPSFNRETSIIVDDPKKTSLTIPVKLKISVYNISCDFLGMDIQDDMGRHEVDVKEYTTKHRINSDKGCLLSFNFDINKVSATSSESVLVMILFDNEIHC